MASETEDGEVGGVESRLSPKVPVPDGRSSAANKQWAKGINIHGLGFILIPLLTFHSQDRCESEKSLGPGQRPPRYPLISQVSIDP